MFFWLSVLLLRVWVCDDDVLRVIDMYAPFIVFCLQKGPVFQ